MSTIDRAVLGLALVLGAAMIATLLSICGTTMQKSYRDIAMVILVGPLLALVVAIALGKTFGSF